MTLIDDVLDLEVPAGLAINLAGDLVAYHTHTKWNHKRGEYRTSSIWIADVEEKKCARRITDGTYHDHSPRWSPDGRYLLFLSDRHNHDAGARNKDYSIYRLDIGSVEEPRSLINTSYFDNIAKFDVSPDPYTIAFISRPRRDYDSESDVVLWGHKLPLNNLYYSDIMYESQEMPEWVRDGYVADFAWSGDGTHTVALTHATADAESAQLHGSTFWIERAYYDMATRIFHVPLEVSGLTWAGPHVYFLSWNVSGDAASGLAAYRLDPFGDHTCEKVAGGEASCARGLKPVRDDVLVHLQEGTEEKLVLLRADRTLLATKKGILDFAATMTRNGETALAIVQGDVNQPSEVFYVAPSGELSQLSDHGGALAGQQAFGTASHIECPTLDSTETIDALFLAPATGRRVWPGRDDEEDYPYFEEDDLVSDTSAPYPTVVLLHDGPYTRAADSFDSQNLDLADLLAPVLLRVGVALLQPNYRGGSGRGARFASSLRHGGLGRHDVSDVVALTDAAVRQGLADPASLFVMGWSHGGYLAYLAALRNGAHGMGWRFIGAVCGAAVSDWDTLVLTSNVGHMQADLVGRAPWRYDPDSNDTSNSSGSGGDATAEHAASPLWEFARAVRQRRIPRLLILHGEADARVPISQTRGFQRALTEASWPAEVITYPRQGHFLEKRACVEDVIKRVVRFTCEPLYLQVDDSILGEE